MNGLEEVMKLRDDTIDFILETCHEIANEHTVSAYDSSQESRIEHAAYKATIEISDGIIAKFGKLRFDGGYRHGVEVG